MRKNFCFKFISQNGASEKKNSEEKNNSEGYKKKLFFPKKRNLEKNLK